MSTHVPETLLMRFVDGDLDEDQAIHVALHLDACPACATRAAALEPLAGALAEISDPPVPELLAAQILTRAEHDSELPIIEIAVGALLLALAALGGWSTFEPAELFVQVGLLVDTFPLLSRAVAAGIPSEAIVVLTGLVLVTTVCLAVASQFARRPSLRERT